MNTNANTTPVNPATAPDHSDHDWNIDEIQCLTEDAARAMALDTMRIKGHNVYFVDFGGYFGFSAIVFADGHHIYYANDYELHHRHSNLDRKGLTDRFVKSLNAKLFTEDEIMSPVTTYVEYEQKQYFLHNYYGMRRDHVSVFRINPTPAEEAEFRRGTAGMVYNPVCFSYCADRAFVERCVKLHIALTKAWTERENDFDAMKSAFLYEMHNHEYAINLQADWDVLSCFGNPEWAGDGASVEVYFDQLNFTPTQRKAYLEARAEYYRQIRESDNY